MGDLFGQPTPVAARPRNSRAFGPGLSVAASSVPLPEKPPDDEYHARNGGRQPRSVEEVQDGVDGPGEGVGEYAYESDGREGPDDDDGKEDRRRDPNLAGQGTHDSPREDHQHRIRRLAECNLGNAHDRPTTLAFKPPHRAIAVPATEQEIQRVRADPPQGSHDEVGRKGGVSGQQQISVAGLQGDEQEGMMGGERWRQGRSDDSACRDDSDRDD